jgi:ubiquinone/menaquinone biosynthesis C-methylase UbiE
VNESERDRRWENGEGYANYIKGELSGFRKQAWKKQIGKHFEAGIPLSILDVGTGPGFFACILSEEGHNVTAIDKSQGMLSHARANAELLGVSPTFCSMDLNDMNFEDDTFDVIVNRNVTWTLTHPAEVYAQFKRVLKPGGKLLIYDANWHMHFFDEEMMKRVCQNEKNHLEKYGEPRLVSGNDTAYFMELPLSNTFRPAWDIEALKRIGFEEIYIEEDIGRFVYEEWEKSLYAESPLFEICAVKPSGNGDRERVRKYWQKRSSTFGFELSEETVTYWKDTISRHLQNGRQLKVLDAGTGPGFMATIMALLGHDVTGVDLCSKMISCAKENTASLGLSINFQCIDAGELPFEDNTFDVVVSRNVLWALTNPEEVLLQWHRVLKQGGTLMYFDGNHYYYLYDAAHREAREAHIAQYGDPHADNSVVNFKEMEEIAYNLPLSKVDRPAWDIATLPGLGYDVTCVEVTCPEEKRSKNDNSSSGYYNTFLVVSQKRNGLGVQ